MAGPVETEVKLRVRDAGAVREALARLGARRSRPRHFEDNRLYDDGSGSLLSGGKLLRLRRTDPGGGVLTFKGPKRLAEGIRSREEIEVAVDEPETLHALLERLGLRPTFRYQKYRECYRLGELEIVLDETPIGTFLELEGPAEAIHTRAGELGYTREDYVAESYPELFRATGGRGDMVFGEEG